MSSNTISYREALAIFINANAHSPEKNTDEALLSFFTTLDKDRATKLALIIADYKRETSRDIDEAYENGFIDAGGRIEP